MPVIADRLFYAAGGGNAGICHMRGMREAGESREEVREAGESREEAREAGN
jgi:hypothetical protein